MNEVSQTSGDKRNIWLRGLFMLLMLLVLHVCGTVLLIIAVIQFVIALVNGGPNDRLVVFGRNLGSYFRQIVLFLTFATEEVPFPFSEWPAD
ncbi:hypothetical protein FGKAn22_02460 [Ferrigenium kumadai]|uniref:DUF4389 domain-containing protein n=1 Tax=Ferrigenium kumadai TaxID=1682490 RepID=A0AAN1VYU0_9PROT|nr:DUF4389 domain-containing protein [Ferrigenium kumadai]BBI98553.1 hypothetical protein FGKAn22_02460 [Ferrigenium kumadai]